MAIDTLKRLLWFVLLCLVQALVFNHIHLFGCATPLVYVWFVVLFPRRYPQWAILLWSFALGFTVDIFSNTPGTACGAMTLIGMLQPYLVEFFAKRDDPEDLMPSLHEMGFFKYTLFLFVIVISYCLVFFTLEQFSFFNWLHWLLCIAGSTAITFVLLLTFESVRRGGNE